MLTVGRLLDHDRNDIIEDEYTTEATNTARDSAATNETPQGPKENPAIYVIF